MKVLLIQPEVRLDDKPFDFPFWAGIFASIVEKKVEPVIEKPIIVKQKAKPVVQAKNEISKKSTNGKPNFYLYYGPYCSWIHNIIWL